MKPTHCFVRVRLNATSRTDAYELISGNEFALAVVEENEFQEVAPGVWQIDIFFSYPGSENVAEGDFEDDIAPEFRALMQAKRFRNTEYEFHIVVGGRHADPFEIRPHVVAMIAVLGGSIFAHRSTTSLIDQDAEVGDGDAEEAG